MNPGEYIVDEKKKKVWKVGLELLEVFDKVCKKYGLSYYAEYGTLLGAVRHKGFIPWDDDIDLVMFRDDYTKLCAIAREEFSYPYCFQNIYSGYFQHPFSKLRDSRTTAIEDGGFDLPPDCNQGIFIDIFPFDSVPDGDSGMENITKIQMELWAIYARPEEIRKLLDEGKPFFLGKEMVSEFLNMDRTSLFREFEGFCQSHWGDSRAVNFLVYELFGICKSRDISWYDDIEYLPFEGIEIPCPREYHQILTRQYGDYMTPVMGGSYHEGIFLDPEEPYTKYLH